MKKSPLLFTLLILIVPAALVYLAARLHAGHQLQLHEERISQDGRAAIAYVVQVNELRLKMPGKSLEEITALVHPPPPPGYTLRPVTAAEREKFPALKDSDFLLQQSGPPHLVIPSAAPPLHIDLNSANAPANANVTATVTPTTTTAAPAAPPAASSATPPATPPAK